MSLHAFAYQKAAAQVVRAVVAAGWFNQERAKTTPWGLEALAGRMRELSPEGIASAATLSRMSKRGYACTPDKIKLLLDIFRLELTKCQNAFDAAVTAGSGSLVERHREVLREFLVQERIIKQAETILAKHHWHPAARRQTRGGRSRNTGPTTLRYEWPKNAHGLNALLVTAYHFRHQFSVLEALLRRGRKDPTAKDLAGQLISELGRKCENIESYLQVLALLLEDSLKHSMGERWQSPHFCIRATALLLAPPNEKAPDMRGQRLLCRVARGTSRDDLPPNRSPEDSVAYIKLCQSKGFIAAKAVSSGEFQSGLGDISDEIRRNLEKRPWVPIVVMAQPIAATLHDAGPTDQKTVGALAIDVMCRREFRDANGELVTEFKENCPWRNLEEANESLISRALVKAAQTLGSILFTEDIRRRIESIV